MIHFTRTVFQGHRGRRLQGCEGDHESCNRKTTDIVAGGDRVRRVATAVYCEGTKVLHILR